MTRFPDLNVEQSPGHEPGLFLSAIKIASKPHGGFDNDVDTMNDVLRSVLRKAPEREFTAKDLKY